MIIWNYFTVEIKLQLDNAQINHCLSLEQVCDELIEKLSIKNGTTDNVKECRYTVPGVYSIGRVYQHLITAVAEDNIEKTIKEVFSSFISEEISNFNSNVYYSNPDYLFWSYREGKMLA